MDSSTQRLAHRQRLGQAGEFLAVWALRLAGWSVLARNVRIAGVEIDLLVRRRDVEVLVEVKTRLRRYQELGPERLISWNQRRRLQRALAARVHSSRATRFRLDLLEISLLPYPRIRRHEDLPSPF